LWSVTFCGTKYRKNGKKGWLKRGKARKYKGFHKKQKMTKTRKRFQQFKATIAKKQDNL